MTPQEVLARHIPWPAPNDDLCRWDNNHWPDDAVDQARQLQEAQERVARLDRDLVVLAAELGSPELGTDIRVERIRARLRNPNDDSGDALQMWDEQRDGPSFAALAQAAGEPPAGDAK